MRKFFTFLIFFVLVPFLSTGQISIDNSSFTYSEDFNGLASTGTSSTMPSGWSFAESGSNANTTYSAGTGSGNGGDTYSFGATASSERALGGLLSGSLIPTFGVVFQNNTGLILRHVSVQYTGEQWRLGATGREDRLDFQLSGNATSLTTGTWIDVNALDFIAPTTTGSTGALDGNSAANRTTISHTILDVNIPAGGSLWFRWTDFNATGADDGLAVDDFSIQSIVLPVTFSYISVDNNKSINNINFSTSSETNNDYFTIERSQDGRSFDAIGKITGAGNSSKEIHYSFTDEKPLQGINYYRIKQTDFDGKYSFSEIRSVRMSGIRNITVTPRTTDGRLEVNTELEDYSIAVYNAAGQEVKMFRALSQDQYLQIDELKAGLYFLRVVSGADIETIRVVKL